jgi:hypothetical protein
LGNYLTILVTSLVAGALVLLIFPVPMYGAIVALASAFCLFLLSPAKSWKRHFLIVGDQQGFMKRLNLADKTVFIDGSNIYHFGLSNGVGPKPLALLIQQLRSEGYRVVCFFDANIYFTLLENNAIQKNETFSSRMLQHIFGLQAAEIYVVPSGIQADRFIIESLSHLPISFAVTNDRYRDYESVYGFLAKDSQWRKGVKIHKGELQLYQHKFKTPLHV